MSSSLPKKVVPLAEGYMRLIAQRSLSEAERTLEKIRLEVKGTPWQKGYMNALEGMLVAIKSGDTRYVYMNRLEASERKMVDEARQRFHKEARNPFEGEFDRGFFAAWAEFLHLFKEIEETKEEPRTLNSFLEKKA
jgi:hypothetical protein